MLLKNTSNSNGDGNEDAERSGGSMGTSNDSFRWARPLLLKDNSDSSTSINSAATVFSNTKNKGDSLYSNDNNSGPSPPPNPTLAPTATCL